MSSAALAPASADAVPRPDLRGCIGHSSWIEATTRLLEAYETFDRTRVDSLAVLDRGTFLGVVERGRLGFLLGSRFGNAVYGDREVRTQLSDSCVRASPTTPLTDIVAAVLRRPADRFAEDVAIVEDSGRYLGMVSVATLVRLQDAMLAEQLQLAESRRGELRERANELSQSLERLRESEGRYRTIFAASPLGIALLDRDGRIETHNHRLAEMFGRAPAGRLADMVRDGDRAALAAVCVAVQDAVPHELELVVDVPHAGPRTFRFVVRAVRETGQHCVTVDDVTEQRALARRVAEREKTELLDSLVGGIAHELNNKLAPVMGYAELVAASLTDRQSAGPEVDWCRTIQTSAAESAGIIRQLLQLSKPLLVEPRPIDLGQAVGDALVMCRFRAREAGAHVATSQLAEDVLVLADPSEIKQVVINLVLNAIDAVAAAPVRSVDVSVAVVGSDAVLVVRDTGHGIAPGLLRRIFDPFFTTKGADRGSGLGLPVCRGIVRRYGGDIDVESDPGRGATFRIRLPRASAIAAADPRTTARDLRIQSHAALRIDDGVLAVASALVVDDEDAVGHLVRSALRRRIGGEVDHVRDGREAVDLLERRAYDVVVCDVRLPGMDGAEVYERAVRGRPELADRFLFVTGDPGTPELRERLARLPVPLVVKPFRPGELADRCAAVASAARGPSAVPAQR